MARRIEKRILEDWFFSFFWLLWRVAVVVVEDKIGRRRDAFYKGDVNEVCEN